VLTGFESAMLAGGLEVQPGRENAPIPDSTPVDPASGQPSIYAGGRALLMVANLPQSPAPSATIDGLPAAVESVQATAIVLRVPAAGSGPAVLRMVIAGEASCPLWCPSVRRLRCSRRLLFWEWRPRRFPSFQAST
jgi:hypothetical protein